MIRPAPRAQIALPGPGNYKNHSLQIRENVDWFNESEVSSLDRIQEITSHMAPAGDSVAGGGFSHGPL
jgi:hypothetical protein